MKGAASVYACRAWWTAGIVLAALSAGTIRGDEPPRQKAQQKTVTIQMTIRYLLYLPKEYRKDKEWPLLLFLHGAGERGEDLEKVKVHGPPKLIEQGKEFPFIVVSPQCPKGRRWEPTALIALLDEIEKEYPVDRRRVYVTGLSMGGFGAWALASFAPERITAIAPICGGGETYWARRLTKVPVWAFHGGKDRVVPPERSRAMVEAVKRAGGTARLTIYPEAGHDSWTATYDNEELYRWLLQQVK